MKFTFIGKKIIILMMASLMLACNAKQEEKNVKEETVVETVVKEEAVANEETVSEAQVIYFVGEYDLAVQLTTKDNWETAELMDNSERVYNLKRESAASGTYLANSEGVSIHFKDGEGILILKDGNEIKVKEFSNN